MRKILLLLAGLALVSSTAACPVQVPRGHPLPLWDRALLVSADELERRLADPRTVVLHVARDRAEYERGHVPGARFLALSAILEERDGIPNLLPPEARLRETFEAVGVSDNSRVVLYGDLDGLAATRAFFSLDYLGKTDAALLDGGLEHWRREGKPLSTEPPALARGGTLTTRVRPDVVVDAEWVRARLNDTAHVVVDARPRAEYRGEVAGAGVPRPGHIPGARNLFWRTALIGDDDTRFRSPEILHASFYLAGARPGQTVVAYCRTGVQASHLYFQARYLRIPVVLYDGSFVDWSRRGEDFPVERPED
jgi:thiosulfate/3-mercaptopyruvate sulfurtransferase